MSLLQLAIGLAFGIVLIRGLAAAWRQVRTWEAARIYWTILLGGVLLAGIVAALN